MSIDDQKKISDALAMIEQAQRIIGSAAQLLCPVDGMADEWTATNRLYDTIKDHWHRVNNRRMNIQQNTPTKKGR